MDGTTLRDYRQALYACFARAGDALFEVADALLTVVARSISSPSANVCPANATRRRQGWFGELL